MFFSSPLVLFSSLRLILVMSYLVSFPSYSSHPLVFSSYLLLVHSLIVSFLLVLFSFCLFSSRLVSIFISSTPLFFISLLMSVLLKLLLVSLLLFQFPVSCLLSFSSAHVLVLSLVLSDSLLLLFLFSHLAAQGLVFPFLFSCLVSSHLISADSLFVLCSFIKFLSLLFLVVTCFSCQSHPLLSSSSFFWSLLCMFSSCRLFSCQFLSFSTHLTLSSVFFLIPPSLLTSPFMLLSLFFRSHQIPSFFLLLSFFLSHLVSLSCPSLFCLWSCSFVSCNMILSLSLVL